MSESRERPPRVPVQVLAEELGVEVRDLLAVARELHIDAQNRITKLHPNDVKRLRAHFAANANDADDQNANED